GAPYGRGALFTYLTAGMFRIFGVGLGVGRILPLVFAGLLTMALFLWLRAEAGRLAAWSGALLFAVAPLSVNMAAFTRFYTLHALLFFLAAVALYQLLQKPWPGRPRAVLLALVFLVGIGIALHLQQITLIGV